MACGSTRSLLVFALGLAMAAACGGSTPTSASAPDAAGAGDSGASSPDGSSSSSGGSSGGGGMDASGSRDSAGGDGGGDPCGVCPSGYTCGAANGLHVCRAPSGIPLFTSVYLVLMENTSLSTLQPAMQNGTAPNLATLAAEFATGSDYHGVAHPSLPNYVALTSGGTQGITCDCEAAPGMGACSITNCNLVLGTCSCEASATNLGDQLDAAHKTWMDFGESMGTPCNVTDSGNYAVRHNPFLYYADIQGDSTRCSAHVVDFSGFKVTSPAAFNFIAPNLVDDMHNPDPTTSVNIPDGDTWIGPQADAIVGSSAYKAGGLLVIVWDEDDDSGGLTGTDDPVPIFVISPYAKHGGYVSSTMANHYSLLATIEDGLGVGRLGMAAGIAPLSDYFPSQ